MLETLDLKDHSKNIRVSQYSLRNFSKIPQKPGVYSWHLIVDKPFEDELRNYYDFYAKRSFQAKVSSWFNESYKGDLFPSGGIDLQRSFPDGDVLKIMTSFLCPPIYIGISRNDLNRRLEEHRDKFQFHLSSEGESAIKLAESDIDTEVESEFFGIRLARLFNQLDGMDENLLFVRVISFEGPIEDTNILYNLEYYLNRSFKPILGRR